MLSSLLLYKYQTKCAMCKREFGYPLKLPLCEVAICGDCRKEESVQTFIHSKKCTYCKEVDVE